MSNPKDIVQEITALSISPEVLTWLRTAHQPRVLHIFEQACNLIHERGEVLSIVTRRIGNGPFNLVIDERIVFSRHIHLGSTISIQNEILWIGDLKIQIKGAKSWSPRPDWGSLHERRNDIIDQIVSLRAGVGDPRIFQDPLLMHPPGFGSYSLRRDSLGMRIICDSQAAIPQYSNSFAYAVATADISSVSNTASRLAGMGIGLTPSGDDFIMGAIYAAWIIHPFETASSLAQGIADLAAPLTTSLSGAWLRSAGRGEAGTLWHNFLNALASESTRTLQDSLTHLLEVGETSGTDALAGFLSVCNFYKEYRNNPCPS